MLIKIIGDIILALGGLGFTFSIISFYAEHRIMKDQLEDLREDKKGMFYKQAREIWKMRIIIIDLTDSRNIHGYLNLTL